MLFLMNNPADPNSNEKLVVGATVSIGTQVFVPFNQILSRADLFSKVSIDNPMYVTSYQGYKVPFIVTTEKGYFVDQLCQIILQAGLDKLKTSTDQEVLFTQALHLTSNVLDPESRDLFLTSIDNFIKYLKNELSFPIKVDATRVRGNIVDTMAKIEAMNNSQGLAELNSAELNYTSFQKTPEDRFFISLPRYETLVRAFREGTQDTLLPQMSEISEPFDNSYLYTENWEKVDKRSFNINDLKGYSEANELPIQENEKEWYDLAIKFMNYAVCQEHKDKSLDELVATGEYSPIVMGYFKDLLGKLLIRHRGYTGLFPADETGDENDLDDDGISAEGTGEDATSSIGYGREAVRKALKDERGVAIVIDPREIVYSYIDKIIQDTKNPYVIVEAIVRLARWGNRKPTQIKLTGADLYLNLEDFSIQKTPKNLKGLKPVLVEGADLVPVAFIKSNISIADRSDYLESIGMDNTRRLNSLLGLQCVRTLEGNVNITVNLDFITIIKEYKNGNKNFKIYGLDYVNGELTVTNSEIFQKVMQKPLISLNSVLTGIESDVYGEYITEVSEDLEKLYSTYGVHSPRISLLKDLSFVSEEQSLVYASQNYLFTNKQDLENNIQSNRQTLETNIDVAVGILTLPAFVWVHTQIENLGGVADIQTYIKMYQTSINKFKLDDINALVHGTVEQEESKPVEVKTNSSIGAVGEGLANVLKSKSFGNEQSKTTDDDIDILDEDSLNDLVQSDKSDILFKTTGKGVVCPLILNTPDSVVAYIQIDNVDGRSIYNFYSTNTTAIDKSKVSAPAKRVPVLTLLLMNAIFHLGKGDVEKIQLRFGSVEELQHIIVTYKELMRRK